MITKKNSNFNFFHFISAIIARNVANTTGRLSAVTFFLCYTFVCT